MFAHSVSMQIVADTPNHRDVVNAVLQAATDYHLLVEDAPQSGIEALARTWPGIDRLRVAVVQSNPDALIFWREVGFIDTGEIKPKYGPYVDDIVILEKTISVNTCEQ